jgi:hypothetical protein
MDSQENPSQDDDAEANASMMVDEAEKHCINKMVEHLETTNEAYDSKSSPLSLLPRREFYTETLQPILTRKRKKNIYSIMSAT